QPEAGGACSTPAPQANLVCSKTFFAYRRLLTAAFWRSMRLIPVANIPQRTACAARIAPDADALAVPQQRDVEIEQHVRVIRQQPEQRGVRGGRPDRLPNQPDALADAMHV